VAKDEFGDRMKRYEGRWAELRTMPGLPVCIRLDGKNFSNLTKRMNRPYDERFQQCMIETCRELVRMSSAVIGYTQSDEISLILWDFGKPGTQIYFDGKVHKLTSVLASAAANVFRIELLKQFGEDAPKVHANFDCRVWDVPSLDEAVNTLVWRELDATKNSVSMLARCHFSHNELMNRGRADMMDMLMTKGINWNDCPAAFKRGTYLKKLEYQITSKDVDVTKLPLKHILNTNPESLIVRSEVFTLSIPPITKLEDRIETLIYGSGLLITEPTKVSKNWTSISAKMIKEEV